MLYRIKISLIFCLISSLVSSCFKEDERVIIIEDKGSQNVKSLVIPNPYSIYTYNTYIDLDSGKVVKSSLISSWDLAFDASPNGWKILVNGAYSKEIFATGSTDYSNDFSSLVVPVWNFDASSGNPDSTAVGRWVINNAGVNEYSNQVYLLGKNNGDGTYQKQKKLQFIKLSDQEVVILVADPKSTSGDTVKVIKNPDYRFVYYSFDTPGLTLLLEPSKNDWDIVTGSYRTILYTDAGVATPYTVRGVLSNYPFVEVLKIKKPDFFAANATDTTGQTFNKSQDAIGYDWKDYNSKDSNPYRIVPGIYYLVKTRSGNLTKFEFTGYTSANAEYGYPSLRLVNLN